jgi:lysophospholipase L1-like esterase
VERDGPVINPQSAPREHIVTLLNRDIADDGRFDITISEQTANGLLSGELGPGAPVQRVTTEFHPNAIRLDGELKGRVGVPFRVTLVPSLVDGRAQISASDISIAAVPIPQFGSDLIDELANEIVNINRILSGWDRVILEAFDVTEDSLRLAGVAGEAIRLPDGAMPGVPAVPPPEIPRPRAQAEAEPSVSPAPDAWMYLALGDSLTSGDGATEPSRNFPTRFHQYLNQTYGVPLRFENLGISGEDSSGFQKGEAPQLDRAIQVIHSLRNDGIPGTQVHLITITMGANDIFPVLQGQVCFADPSSSGCQKLLDDAIALYEVRMRQAMSRLVTAVEPGTVILYASYYNPFNFGTGLVFEAVSQQTVDKLNEAVSRVSLAHGATIAHVGSLFGGLAFGITNMSAGDIHPNDEGHGVATRAFQDAYEAVAISG